MSINSRIQYLENQIIQLKKTISELSNKNYIPTISTVGGQQSRATITPVDYKSGLCSICGGPVIWNNSEIGQPPINQETPNPEDPENIKYAKGYNKHSHSRFSGGCLIKGVVEVVEYDFDGTPISNKHSQGYWVTIPEIKTEINTNKETVEKIGVLDLVFNPDTKTWGCPAYEIDVERCYLVRRDSDGEIMLDSNGVEMKSPLYNSDSTKTSVVWDTNAQCWRFYAVYAPDPSQV